MSGDLMQPGADAMLDGTAIPTTLYLQGHTDDPGADGTANVGANSTRIALASWNAAESGGAGFRRKTNSTTVLSGAASTDETWTWVTLWSDATDGTVWFVDQLASSVDLITGQAVQIIAGAVSIAFPVKA